MFGRGEAIDYFEDGAELTLDLSVFDSSSRKVLDIVRGRRRPCLENVVTLKNLNCADEPNALPLLNSVAPHVEELDLCRARPPHLRVVSRMKTLAKLDVRTERRLLLNRGEVLPSLPLQLRELRIGAARKEQLMLIPRMKRLRRLAIHGVNSSSMAMVQMPTPAHPPQVRWLQLWLRPAQKALALSLINCFGSSLRELRFRCESGKSVDSDWFHFPDLARDLSRCGSTLPKLRRLVLLRDRDWDGPCSPVESDADSSDSSDADQRDSSDSSDEEDSDSSHSAVSTSSNDTSLEDSDSAAESSDSGVHDVKSCKRQLRSIEKWLQRRTGVTRKVTVSCDSCHVKPGTRW